MREECEQLGLRNDKNGFLSPLIAYVSAEKLFNFAFVALRCRNNLFL